MSILIGDASQFDGARGAQERHIPYEDSIRLLHMLSNGHTRFCDFDTCTEFPAFEGIGDSLGWIGVGHSWNLDADAPKTRRRSQGHAFGSSG